jgi:hypothetical protein
MKFARTGIPSAAIAAALVMALIPATTRAQSLTMDNFNMGGGKVGPIASDRLPSG